MELICIAHRGEAQSFIKSLGLKAIDQYFYKNAENKSLLITGEGPFDVLTKLPFYLAKYEITSLINFGIAGSLTQSLKIDNIYPVRTSYAFGLDGPRFHSYSTRKTQPNSEDDKKLNLDCITTEKRVLDDEYAKTLSSFADIIDRELWAIGKVAHQYKIPFQSFKLISDLAGSTTKCFDLKQKALEFSDSLFDYYNELKITAPEKKDKGSILLPFRSSFTQTKRIESLLLKLQESSTIDDVIKESGAAELQTKDKEKANYLIKHLENLINPINTLIDKKMHKIISPLEKIGAHILYDKKLDHKKITLKMEINHQQNIKNLIKELESFDFNQIENLWNGEIDV